MNVQTMIKKKLFKGMLGGGGVQTWNPAQTLEGVLPTGWWKPNDTSTLFQDNAKTTPAAADADKIGAIADKSGNGNDLPSISDATRPARKNNAMNGKVGMYIDTTSKGVKKTGMVDASYQKAITYFICSNGVSGNAAQAGLDAVLVGSNFAKPRYVNHDLIGFNTALTTQSIRTDQSVANGRSIYAYSYNGTRAVMKAIRNTRVWPMTVNDSVGDFGIGYNNLGNIPASVMEAIVYKKGLLNSSLQTLFDYGISECGLTVPAVSKNVIFIGDSLTYGTGSGLGNNYPDQFMAAKNDATLNQYVVGADNGLTANSLRINYLNVSNEFISNGDTVFYWLGTNDIGIGQTDAQVIADITAVCNSIKTAHPTCKLVVCTIIARGTYTAGQETYRLAVNTSINASHTYCDYVLDLAADARLSNANDTTYYNADKVHLNDTGYGVVKDLATTLYNSIQ